MSKREWKEEPLWLYQLWWGGGRTKIRWQQKRFGIFLYYIPSWMSCVLCAQKWLWTVHLYWRRGGTDKWGRKLECWPWLASWPSQLEDSGPVGLIFTMTGAGKGNPCCLTWKELVSWEHSSCWYTAHSSLGMTLIRANTLAFGLIGKTDHIEL